MRFQVWGWAVVEFTWSGRGGSSRIGAFAVGEDVVEGAEVGRRGGLAGVEPRVAHLLTGLQPQCLQLHRTGNESHVGVLFDQTSDPPIIVVLFLMIKFKISFQISINWSKSNWLNYNQFQFHWINKSTLLKIQFIEIFE